MPPALINGYDIETLDFHPWIIDPIVLLNYGGDDEEEDDDDGDDEDEEDNQKKSKIKNYFYSI